MCGCDDVTDNVLTEKCIFYVSERKSIVQKTITSVHSTIATAIRFHEFSQTKKLSSYQSVAFSRNESTILKYFHRVIKQLHDDFCYSLASSVHPNQQPAPLAGAGWMESRLPTNRKCFSVPIDSQWFANCSVIIILIESCCGWTRFLTRPNPKISRRMQFLCDILLSLKFLSYDFLRHTNQ